MNDYQREQFSAIVTAKNHIDAMKAAERSALQGLMGAYLNFRKQTALFLERHFGAVCNRTCYENRKSTCCSKEGIITFFADTVVNVLESSERQIAALLFRLQTKNTGLNCIYLGDGGCLWQVKPIVCEMFLCDAAQREVFSKENKLENQWKALRVREKSFTWPDRPVLFDQLEEIFITAGYESPLMYLHNSPGLLRVKQQSHSDAKPIRP